MKRIIFGIAILICNQNLFAQESNTSNNKNEIKFNLPMAIYGLPELSYERIVEDNMSYGVSLSIGLDKPYDYYSGNGIPERAIVCPYYRVYFGKKRAAGFYIEGNMAVSSQKQKNVPDYTSSGAYVYKDVTSTGFGFGGALGVKLLAKNGFVGDIYAGWGRLFGDNASYNGYPRLGVCIGRRF
jgi:hypothetical protein